MPRHSRGFAIPCLCCAIIAAEDCSSTSTPRVPAEPPITGANQSNAAPIEVDSTRRFQTTISVDSTLSSDEIAGTVVSASTGAPVLRAEVWIDYPNHRHTERTVYGDTEGNFLMGGLPGEPGVLHVQGDGFARDSVTINPQSKPRVRFALRVIPIILRY
jgi:carboxypeptidase family protein